MRKTHIMVGTRHGNYFVNRHWLDTTAVIIGRWTKAGSPKAPITGGTLVDLHGRLQPIPWYDPDFGRGKKVAA